ncbi:MAG: alpha/beta hydrolase [Chitinophagaceae bacterium]|nr:alpha/beta hydrolase [Chitinophagaceae bacterium]
MKTFFYSIVLSAPLIFSCKKEEKVSLPAETRPDVAYGTDPKQKMDVYLPAGRNTRSTKVIIMIHGGGWVSGDKSDFSQFVDTLKRRLPDYAIFNINYRLADGTNNLFPTQENDVKAAVEFIYGKRQEYQISDKLVLVGASAGGHLSLLQAYKYNSPVKIKAVIDFFGPTELVSFYNSPPNPTIPQLLRQVTGGTPVSHATLYFQSSPYNFVTPQSPPTMILQGGLDIVVSPSQSEMLKNRLQANGVAHEYVFYPGEAHGWVGATLTDSFNRIDRFLRQHVN